LQVVARLLRNKGKAEEAADVYLELLELRRKNLGEKHGRVAETVTELAKVLTVSHNEVQFERLAGDFPKAWITRSEDLAQQGRWSESLAAAVSFLQIEPGEYRGYYHAAPLLVQIGDRAAYEELCAKITTLFAGTTNLATADRMAKACLILPRPGADLKVASELASVAVAGGQKDSAAKGTMALAEYRQGHWDQATDWAMKAAENPSPSSRAEAYAILAMAQHQSKETEAARASLKKCTETVQTKLPKPEDGDLGGDWRGWIYAHALQSEAKRMIDGEPSSDARPANLPP
jgi:tetratricopeptide (TPR) repeat protein